MSGLSMLTLSCCTPPPPDAMTTRSFRMPTCSATSAVVSAWVMWARGQMKFAPVCGEPMPDSTEPLKNQLLRGLRMRRRVTA